MKTLDTREQHYQLGQTVTYIMNKKPIQAVVRCVNKIVSENEESIVTHYNYDLTAKNEFETFIQGVPQFGLDRRNGVYK